MLNTPCSRRGMVTSPHHLASESGLRVLRDGGNAVEAMLAMAGTLAVVYPHMNSIGGDGFWLISTDGKPPIAVDACGAAAKAATVELYKSKGLSAVPPRGPLAANTVAATLSGWAEAMAISQEIGGKMPLSRLLEDAIWSAENGFVVTRSQQEMTEAKLNELRDSPNFLDTFVPGGKVPREGEIMKAPALGATLRRIAEHGPMDAYHGQLAKDIAADLARCGSPVALEDLQAHKAQRREALSVKVNGARLYNFPPPTQGLASLMILALFERLKIAECESLDYLHGIIEATKQAFIVRDAIISDPALMTEKCEDYLTDAKLDELAARIDRKRALDWPHVANRGDTIWAGAIDSNGTAVSFIQSIYFEFGSGCVLDNTGIIWQNRGSSFILDGDGPRALRPGRKPFHTLNPAMAIFDDDRRMVYGNMGGEGQPQTQSAIFSRYAIYGQGLQEAITAPRWLLGKTWGEDTMSLKLESRFDPALIEAMRAAGHTVEVLPAFSALMGHGGAVVRHPEGVFEGATDPRSDGAAMGF